MVPFSCLYSWNGLVYRIKHKTCVPKSSIFNTDITDVVFRKENETPNIKYITSMPQLKLFEWISYETECGKNVSSMLQQVIVDDTQLICLFLLDFVTLKTKAH